MFGAGRVCCLRNVLRWFGAPRNPFSLSRRRVSRTMTGGDGRRWWCSAAHVVLVFSSRLLRSASTLRQVSSRSCWRTYLVAAPVQAGVLTNQPRARHVVPPTDSMGQPLRFMRAARSHGDRGDGALVVHVDGAVRTERRRGVGVSSRVQVGWCRVRVGRAGLEWCALLDAFAISPAQVRTHLSR